MRVYFELIVGEEHFETALWSTSLISGLMVHLLKIQIMEKDYRD